MEDKQLVKLAQKAKENSYSPYSSFRVGAAVECDDGSVYTGCNVENSAFGPSVCAERVAIFKAVSEGKKNFKKIAIVSDSEDYTYPCGVCRQVMAEFSPDIDVIVTKSNGEFIHKNFKTDILPNSFSFKA